ncbi:DUF3772 domain-containing protein [Mangrovicoccus algicola]|uniref:Mechanosensitive ion channel family protein n=1 Tax=Mangrovicoccus algicola TaxID=2771008 RepID=A0A8J6YT96_9RHOB|nr:DUF3772 domain-containing protein [Mangrovicoccus algicola]MBE3637057.1 mechanosensitive ion channel family protein [Mangrovicoccus algicola]
MAAAAALLVACLLLAAPLRAQSSEDYDAWERLAARVEQTLAVDAAPDSALTALRDQVVSWRDKFLADNTLNSRRLETIDRRLSMLPEPPAEGETEPEAVTAERASLTEQRSVVEEPSVKAQLAFAHADGLVREIDEELRQRQASELMQRRPTPLNPLNWTDTLREVGASLASVPREMLGLYSSAEARRERLEGLPSALALAAAGLVLMWRSGRWTRGILHFGQFLGNRFARLGAQLTGVTLQLLLPVAGLVLVLTAISRSGLLGDTGSGLLEGVSTFAMTLILGTWLVLRIYPRSPQEGLQDGADLLPERLSATARRVSTGLVLVLALFAGITRAAENLGYSEAAQDYLGFIFVVMASAALFNIGRLYRARNVLSHGARTDPAAADPGEDGHFGRRVIAALAGLARVIAIAGPLAGAAGYLRAADALVFPACSTFFLLAGLGRAQRLVAQVFVVLNHGDTRAANGLGATLAGGVLYVLAVPLMALLWGARAADLGEVWTSLRTGMTLGGVQISPDLVLVVVLVFAAGFVLTRFTQGVLSQAILPKTRLDLGAQRAITSGAGYVGFFLAGLAAFTSAGLDLSSIAIVAGALSVGIGFGLQTIVSNFVSGIILLIERPVSEGDWIEVGGQMGYVKAIAVRATRIETFDRTDVIVPNSDLVSGVVTNWTRGNLIGRAIVPVGVAYGSDTRQVERILQEIAEAHPLVAMSPPPQVLFMGLGGSSLDFEIRVILRDINFLLNVKSDINHEIVRRFLEEGIQIPFPQQDVWLHEASGPRSHPVMRPETGTASEAPGAARPGPGRGGAMLSSADMDGAGEADGR